MDTEGNKGPFWVLDSSTVKVVGQLRQISLEELKAVLGRGGIQVVESRWSGDLVVVGEGGEEELAETTRFHQSRSLTEDAFLEMLGLGQGLNVHLERLRSVLHEPPDETTWRRLCLMLDLGAEHQASGVVEYVGQHLEGWPAQVRSLPKRWVSRLLEGADDSAEVLVGLGRLGRFGELGAEDLTRALSHPVLTGLAVVDLCGSGLTSSVLEEVLRRGLPEGTRELRLANNRLDDEAGQALGASRQASGWKRLWLGDNRLGEEGLVSMIAGGRLGGLQRLSVCRLKADEAGLGAGGLESLRRLEGLTHLDLRGVPMPLRSVMRWRVVGGPPEGLVHLDVGNCGLEDRGVELLAEIAPRSLRSLSLDSNKVGDRGVEALLTSPLLTSLSWLSLRGPSLEPDERLSEAGFVAAARAGFALELRHLELGSNGLGSEGVVGLLKTGALLGLEHLGLSYNNVEADAFEALAQSGPQMVLRGLRTLDLAGNRLGVPGLKALLESGLLSGLERLELSLCDAGPAGAELLAARIPGGLLDLDLSYNLLGDQGAVALAGASRLQGLTLLDLSYNNLSREGATAVVQSPWLGRLRRLDLRGNHLFGGVKELQWMAPGCRILG